MKGNLALIYYTAEHTMSSGPMMSMAPPTDTPVEWRQKRQRLTATSRCAPERWAPLTSASTASPGANEQEMPYPPRCTTPPVEGIALLKTMSPTSVMERTAHIVQSASSANQHAAAVEENVLARLMALAEHVYVQGLDTQIPKDIVSLAPDEYAVPRKAAVGEPGM